MAQPHLHGLPGINPNNAIRMQLTDADQIDQSLTLLAEDLVSGLISMTPAATRTLTLPSSTDLTINQTLLAGLDVSDAIPFTVRNQSAVGSGFDLIIALGAGGIADSETNLVVGAASHNDYILRVDDANPTAPSYTLFQLDGGLASAGAVPQVANVSATGGIAGTTTFNGAATYQLLTNVTLTADPQATNSGILIIPNALPVASQLQITVAGNYEVSVSISGSFVIAAAPARATTLIGLGTAAVAPTIAVTQFEIDPSVNNQILSSVSGSTILPLAVGDLINVYINGFFGLGAADTIQPTSVYLSAQLVK